MNMIPVFVVLIVFTFVFGVIKMAFDYNRSKMLTGSGNGGASLKTSELEALIRGAVEDAVQPILDRLDETDRRLQDHDVHLLDEGRENDSSDLSPS